MNAISPVAEYLSMAKGVQSMKELVAVVLTLDEEKHIADCVQSLTWCDAVVVWDSFSTDHTCQMAQEKGALVVQHPFRGYGSQRQAAMDAITAEWILFVDADERVPPALAQEIRTVIREQPDVVGWWIPRHNYIFGKVILHTGWYPDYQLRLVRPNRGRWDPGREVHELAVLDGPAGHLQNVLIHYNYDSLQQFHAKQTKYTAYDAEILFKRGQRAKVWSPISMPIRHFKWRYVDLAGYRDGWHGLWLSLLMSYYEGLKYMVLADLWRTRQGHRSSPEDG
jgi:glycosyltransferase involved in cell wall biosynthesis